MRILYVASEVSPFAFTGGLGDVLGALPKEVARLDDNAVIECILPLYRNVSSEFRERMTKLIDISFRLSWRETGCTVYLLKTHEINYYFVENYYYFDRPMMYGDYDDAERFAFFSKAVIEFIIQYNNFPDILHAHDWQTALSIIYLKTIYSENPKLKNIKTIFTIHNIEFQGKYDSYILGNVFGLGNEYLDTVCHGECINLMKGALCLADRVTTVSETYAEELEYDFYSFGLSDIIKSISHKLTGIVNGIDTSIFSPAYDNKIYSKYSLRTVRSGKEKNKNSLLRDMGILENIDYPLLSVVSRLTDQKGMDLLLHVAEELLSLDVNFILLGTGDKKYEQAFTDLDRNFSNFKAIISFDRTLAGRIYAAADMFIMPSKREPCGLAQMIGCSYGTVPIVRSTGGLKDTIQRYDEKTDTGNGFVFENYNAHELLYTVKEALHVFKSKEKWHKLRQRAMSADFSWAKSARKYLEIYKDLV